MNQLLQLEKWKPYICDEIVAPLCHSQFIEQCYTQPSLNCLMTFVEQHYHYSKNFTRFLTALLSNIDDNDHFRKLAGNLLEELGFTDKHNVPHIEIYKNMMKSMKIQLSEFIFPETRNLIQTMMEYCRNVNPLYGLSALCFGAEAIVPLIYSAVYNAFKALGYNDQVLLFFKLHIQCDGDHAEVMKQLLQHYIVDTDYDLKIVQRIVNVMIHKRKNLLETIVVRSSGEHHVAIA